ncbi:MAG: type VI secretion system protein ImpL [Desulfobacteraceae bacterium]|nr:type VI secretion system protein ImpL [Desulfobacteraceae bacterium]MBC2754364.1 type VI secretion system protein ImpL [Desulfobacteraceae bacterium]
MKNLIISILKGFLVISLLLFIAFLVFGVVLSIDLPWWAGLFVLTGLLGLWMGVLFLKKIWLKNREQRFVDQIIENDDAYAQTLGGKEKNSSQELQGRWKEAIDALRKSHLKKQGNPLYVLPWYMIIGESGAGKTTAIKSARLSSSFAEISSTSGISGTRNCDWWFFEKAIIIDTAGRYAIPVDEGRDKDEWHRFLSLLSKFRKKEPLNGLVITIAADKLIDPGTESLEENGKSIRSRIDELMKVLGAKFPVYVLITKCDLVKGMTHFCDQISEKNHDQAMGAINQDFSSDAVNFIERTMLFIEERLKDLRLLLFNKLASKEAEVGLLVFPEEYKKLKPGLESFVRSAFSENPYQESPILRGLFFSSGKQEGSPFSYFLKDLGLIEQKEVLPGTDKGLFLHDFFSKILPKDRGLYAPTHQTVEWSRLTRNMGLTSWLAIAIAVCGLLSFSFVKNLKTLRDVSREFMKPSMMQGEIIEDTITMDRFREAVLRVEDQNKSWWVPRLGLNESKEIEGKLKRRYCSQYRNAFLTTYDEQMAETMAYFSFRTSDEVMGRYVAHLVKRINLLRARIEGENLKDLLSRPQPSFDTVSLESDQNPASDVNQKLTRLYRYFLIWQVEDKTSLNQEMNDLQAWLKHILTLEDITLNWLITWVNSDPSFSPIRMADFWGGSIAQPWEVNVLPAYTVAGKEKIDGFVHEIDSALFDPLIIAEQKLDFEKWYFQSYLKTWHDFAKVFPDGYKTLENKDAWERVVSRMGSDQDPYLSLLSKMADELKPFSKAQNRPDWMTFIYDVNKIKLQVLAKEKFDVQENGLLEKASKKVISTFDKVETAVGVSVQDTMDTDNLFSAANAFRAYQNALTEMVPVSTSQRFAYELAMNMYQNPEMAISEEKSPFLEAGNALIEMEKLLIDQVSNLGLKIQLKEMTDLLAGPKELLHEFIFRETACYLQSLWETDVLMAVKNAPADQNLNLILMGEDGFARRFIDGPARAFIGQNLDGQYYSKEVMGKRIDLEEYFLSYLTKSAKVTRLMNKSYSVFISSEPTGANQDARVRPHATTLELQCSPETPPLVNHNYPVSKTFEWSPLTCGEVALKIDVGNTVLTKKYKGYLAFAEFIEEFENGQRVFFPREFPVEEWALKGMGVKYISVKYQFKGHQPVLGILRAAPGEIPEEIAGCWD